MSPPLPLMICSARETFGNAHQWKMHTLQYSKQDKLASCICWKHKMGHSPDENRPKARCGFAIPWKNEIDLQINCGQMQVECCCR